MCWSRLVAAVPSEALKDGGSGSGSGGGGGGSEEEPLEQPSGSDGGLLHGAGHPAHHAANMQVRFHSASR